MSNEIFEKLNYQFTQLPLLKVALTHRSRGGEHNERLEFLGDSVVNFVIAEVLFHRFPGATEGELSRWRASLVNRDTLADLAKDFELGKYLFLGPGEVRSKGHERQSILSCAMEAVIGALYLDAGFEVARQKILEWYTPLIEMLSDAGNHKDPKTLLQEYMQSRRHALPTYHIDKIEGEAHQQIFIVSCNINGMEKTIGTGTSRRRAEQDAASRMLEVLKK